MEKKISYGELTKGEKLLLPIVNEVSLIAANDWKIAGKTVHKINGRSFITGKHQYVSDMKLPGMLYGKILRAPAYNAKLTHIDLTAAIRFIDSNSPQLVYIFFSISLLVRLMERYTALIVVFYKRHGKRCPYPSN